MLDAFIIESLQSIGMPRDVAPPAAITRSWDHQEVDALRRAVDTFLSEKRDSFVEWHKKIEGLAAKISKIPANEVATSVQMQSLDKCVLKIEEKAEGWIVQCRQHWNQIELSRRTLNLSTDRRALYKSMYEEARVNDEKFLRTLLDFAWIVRSFRAQVAPDKGTGQSFDNPDDLERFLASA